MDAVEQIALYNTLFYVSLGVFALGLVMAVLFFFYFDIPTVYAMMTGKARKETIRRMEEQNAKTGNLKISFPDQSGGIGRSGKTGRTGTGGKSSGIGKTGAEKKAPLQKQPMAVKQSEQDAGILQMDTPETTNLQAEAGPTVLLEEGSEHLAPSPLPEAAPVAEPPRIPFVITERTVVIHTDEII